MLSGPLGGPWTAKDPFFSDSKQIPRLRVGTSSYFVAHIFELSRKSKRQWLTLIFSVKTYNHKAKRKCFFGAYTNIKKSGQTGKALNPFHLEFMK